MESVNFITLENDGTDQIVSFAIEVDELEIKSLTLIRTPKFETLLDETERGVSVSIGYEYEDDFDLLTAVRLEANLVTVTTQASRYELDISRVDPTEVSEMKALFERMNFDNRFTIEYL